jgi:hypothetical protein
LIYEDVEVTKSLVEMSKNKKYRYRLLKDALKYNIGINKIRIILGYIQELSLSNVFNGLLTFEMFNKEDLTSDEQDILKMIISKVSDYDINDDPVPFFEFLSYSTLNIKYKAIVFNIVNDRIKVDGDVGFKEKHLDDYLDYIIDMHESGEPIRYVVIVDTIELFEDKIENLSEAVMDKRKSVLLHQIEEDEEEDEGEEDEE